MNSNTLDLQPDLPPPRRVKREYQTPPDSGQAGVAVGLDRHRPRPKPSLEPEPKAERQERLPEIVSAAALLADTLCREPVQLIHGILHQGARLALGGHSGSYKSHTLLDMALSVQAGQPFLGWRTQRGRVLYINLELAAWSIKRRIQAIAKAKQIADVTGLDLLNLRGWRGERLAELIEMRLSRATGNGERYALIVLDPVYKLLAGRDENSASDIEQLTGDLATLAEDQAASLAFAAHYSKGNQATKEAMDRIGGSGVFARDADAIITLTKHKCEERRAYTVELAKLRDLPEQPPFVVEWKYPVMVRARDLDPDDLKRAGGRKPEHSLNDLMDLLPEAGLDGKDWMVAAGARGISRATYFRLRQQVVAGQIAEQNSEGIWQRVS